MEENLLRYLWKNTRPQQLFILAVTAASLIPYFFALDLPKQIINGPIQGGGFEGPASVQEYFRIGYNLPLIGKFELFDGIELDRLQALLALSTAFLSMVVLNGLFKLYINTYKGRLGERMLRRIRYELVDRVLRFPPWYFNRIKSAEVATMVKDEVEPLGGFTGDAFVLPALLIGQALTALIFIVVQNIWLGTIAAGMIAVQIILIPRMRRKLLELSRLRQLTARQLSGRVSEIVDGIGVIHGNDTSNLERADIAWRLGRIFSIRYQLYQWKFLVKFINNFLVQITPFFFYLVGGYFVLLGRLDLGQLVAVISAYKDLPGPMKDLIDWDQARQDMQVKYAQVYQQFNVDPMIDHSIQTVPQHPVTPIQSALVVDMLTLVDDSGARLLERVSAEIRPNETVAIVGSSGSGADAFADVLGRLAWPSSGAVTIDGRNLLELPESLTGRRISYASGEPFLLHGTLHDNLMYGLKHSPAPGTRKEHPEEDYDLEWHVAEARKAGNPTFDVNCDWIDYEAVGARGPDDLSGSIRPVLEAVLIADDIFDLALRATVQTDAQPHLSQNIVELRSAFRDRLAEEKLDEIVIPFHYDLYNAQATVIENLLFGTISRSGISDRHFASHPHFHRVLRDADLGEQLYRVGLAIAENTVELFQDLPPGHPFFQQLTFMKIEDIPVYQAKLQRLAGLPPDQVLPEDRDDFLRLSFGYVEPRHRFGILNDELMRKVVAARKLFHTDMPVDLTGSVERFDPECYAPSASLMDNIVFGRVAQDVADATDRIRTILIDLISKLDLADEVISIGLDFDVGSGGKRLTIVQRQKLNLARALIKRSDYFIFNQPLSSLDRSSQERIIRRVVQELHKEGQRPAILWVLSDPQLAEIFDRILVFHRGHLIASGDYAQLSQNSEIFRQLMA